MWRIAREVLSLVKKIEADRRAGWIAYFATKKENKLLQARILEMMPQDIKPGDRLPVRTDAD
jgi:ATP-dependent RNA circularization protein (DNA/RNA ligase family)